MTLSVQYNLTLCSIATGNVGRIIVYTIPYGTKFSRHILFAVLVDCFGTSKACEMFPVYYISTVNH